jgi:hypothetical protein
MLATTNKSVGYRITIIDNSNSIEFGRGYGDNISQAMQNAISCEEVNSLFDACIENQISLNLIVTTLYATGVDVSRKFPFTEFYSVYKEL